MTEKIAVKMDGTPLVFGLRKHFSHGLQHTRTLVANHQFHPIQATATQPLEETDPAGLVLLHTLNSAQNLAVSVLINSNSNPNSYIFKFSVPVAAQIDPIHIDIRIPPTLQRTVPPIFKVDIRFLIQLADSGRIDLAAPQGLGDILHTPDGYAHQVHLNEDPFHTALPMAIPLNDGGFKRNALEFGNLESNISESGGEIAVVVATAIALALLVTLVPSSLGQLLRFGPKQLDERFLYTASHKFLKFDLDYGLFSCTIFSDMVCCLLSKWCVVTSFYQRSANHVSLFHSLLFAKNIIPDLTAMQGYWSKTSR